MCTTWSALDLNDCLELSLLSVSLHWTKRCMKNKLYWGNSLRFESHWLLQLVYSVKRKFVYRYEIKSKDNNQSSEKEKLIGRAAFF